MKIRLSDIDENGLSINVSEKLEDIDNRLKEESGVSFISPVNANLKIERLESKIFVKGVFDLDIKINCARCLNDFFSRIRSDINLVFLKSPDEEDEIAKTGADINYYTGMEIDITQMLREEVIFNLPLKPLCKPECRGLCHKCGADLNKGKCGCSEEKYIDARLKKLKEFKSKM